MYLLRALFWTGVVALFVPFQSFDLVRGDVRVDRPALMREIEALPHYCDRNADVCAKAGDVFAQMRKDGLSLLADVTDRRTLARMASLAQDALSADHEVSFDDRTAVHFRP